MNEPLNPSIELSPDYLWISSEEAQKLLAQKTNERIKGIELTRILKSLRKTTTPSRAALILELVNLRIRARNKFQLADRMFFTRDSLEMATDEKIATYKAKRFSSLNSVADVCCGIGGDLLGLSRNKLGSTFGFDTDPVAVKFANLNLKTHNAAASAEVLSFDSIDLSEFDAVHIDPERRKFGKSSAGSKFSPSLNSILAQMNKTSLAIKIAPATDFPATAMQGCEFEWIGHSRECKQQVAWTREMVRNPNSRVATIVDTKPVSFSSSFEKIEATAPSFCHRIGNYVFEPHNVVLAARLTDCLAEELSLQRIHPGIAYLTGNNHLTHPLVSAFEVLESLPADFKKVSAAMQPYGFGEIEFKKRGVTESVVAPFKKIKRGDQKEIGTLIFTEFRNQHFVIIAKRIG